MPVTRVKRWPKAPEPPPEPPKGFCTQPVDGPTPTWPTNRQSGAACKHGEGSCETCGTTDRREVVHTTEGGLGAVGKLRERGRKKKPKGRTK
jgi:hypothetical protein